MSKVIVFGATGYAGGHISAELLRRGFDVVGVARNTSGLAPAPSLTAVSGSLFDPTFVREVSQDASAIVVALHAAADADGNKLVNAVPSLVEAAKASGARLAIVGGAGSLRVSPDGPLLFDTPEFPDQFKDEAVSSSQILDALKSSDGVDWFYLSPAASFGSYNPGEGTGKYRTSDDILLTDENGESRLSGADYALAFVDELETPRHHNARFAVAY